MLCRDNLPRPPVSADSGGSSTHRYSPWGSRTGLNAVLAWGGTKGNSYPWPKLSVFPIAASSLRSHFTGFLQSGGMINVFEGSVERQASGTNAAARHKNPGEVRPLCDPTRMCKIQKP